MANDKKSWVKVYTIFDEVLGQMLKSILEDNGICVDVFYYQAGSVLNLVQPSAAKGEIRVEEAKIKKEKKIIVEFENKFI
jgi:hypothetical protein